VQRLFVKTLFKKHHHAVRLEVSFMHAEDVSLEVSPSPPLEQSFPVSTISKRLSQAKFITLNIHVNRLAGRLEGIRQQFAEGGTISACGIRTGERSL